MMMLNWLESIGAACVVYVVYAMVSAIYRLFLRPMDLGKYKRRDSWALVTGASDGIGLGFVQILAREGFNVLLVSRSREKLERVVGELRGEFKRVKFEYCVSEAEDHKSIEAVVNAAKDKDIAILVNNVGIGQGAPGRVEHVQADILERLVKVNCIYPLLLSKHIIPLMKKRKTPGAVVNLSSVTALMPIPFNATYAATKSFNRLLSTSLSGELFDSQIDVLSVEPGFVASNMTQMKKGPLVCDPTECAKGALRQMGMMEALPHWKHLLMLNGVKLLTETMMPALYRPFILNKVYKGMAAKRSGKSIAD